MNAAWKDQIFSFIKEEIRGGNNVLLEKSKKVVRS